MVHFIISSLNPSHGSLRCHDWDISNQNPPQLSIISIKHKFGNTKPCPFFHAINPGVVNLPPSLNCLLVDYFRKCVKQVHVWLRVRMCDWGCTCVIESAHVYLRVHVWLSVHVWLRAHVWLRTYMCDWEYICVIESSYVWLRVYMCGWECTLFVCRCVHKSM